MKKIKIISLILLTFLILCLEGCYAAPSVIDTGIAFATENDFITETDSVSESTLDIFDVDYWNPSKFWFLSLQDFNNFANTGSMDEQNFATFPDIFYGSDIDGDDPNALQNANYDNFTKNYIEIEKFVELNSDEDEMYAVSVENANGLLWWRCEVFYNKNLWNVELGYSNDYPPYNGKTLEEYCSDLGIKTTRNPNEESDEVLHIVRTVNGVDVMQYKLDGNIYMFTIYYKTYYFNVEVSRERLSELWNTNGDDSIKAFLSEDEEVFNAAVQNVIECIDMKLATENE